jgi:hypothetical protein
MTTGGRNKQIIDIKQCLGTLKSFCFILTMMFTKFYHLIALSMKNIFSQYYLINSITLHIGILVALLFKKLSGPSPHDEQRSSGPRPVKLYSDQQILQLIFRTT